MATGKVPYETRELGRIRLDRREERFVELPATSKETGYAFVRKWYRVFFSSNAVVKPWDGTVFVGQLNKDDYILHKYCTCLSITRIEVKLHLFFNTSTRSLRDYRLASKLILHYISL